MKKTQFIKIKQIPYEPELNLAIQVSNGLFSGYIEIDTYDSDIRDLAKKLIDYPKTIKDRIDFKIGEREKWAFYFFLQVYAYDNLGHSIIEFRLDNNKKDFEKESAQFGILCNPADINDLGKILLEWISQKGNREDFYWEIDAN